VTAAPSTRVLLVRHAEPDAWSRGRCCGRTDVPLSPAGRRQARALGRGLARGGPDAVYASPRTRAVETAAAIGAAAGLPVTVADALAEIDFGELEGLPYDEIASSRPSVYRRWMTAPARVRFPGGEAFADVRARVVPWLDATRRRHEGRCAVVVTHGGPIRAVLGGVLELPDRAVFRLDLGHAGVTLVEWIGDAPVVRYVNVAGAGRPASRDVAMAPAARSGTTR